MSSPTRRKELQALHEREAIERENEQNRKANLIFYDAIEEIQSIEDVKALLHRLTEKLNVAYDA